MAINGAEPLDPAQVEDFVEAGRRHGMRPGAGVPAFGMAEVPLAGTFVELMTGLRTDCVDRRVLETERYAAPVANDNRDDRTVRRLARLGRPVPGLEIRVVDPHKIEFRLKEPRPAKFMLGAFASGWNVIVRKKTLEEHDGKTTLTTTSRFDTAEDRDGMLESGMEVGAAETWDRLDEYLEVLKQRG